MQRHVIFALLIPAVLLMVGCDSGIELGQVTGTVTKDGEPAPEIWINFMPDPDEGTEGAISSAITDEDGRYELQYQGETKEPGAAVGSHRVVVNDLVPENFRGQGRPPKSRVRPEMMHAGDTPFRFEVKPGQQQIDIDLDI
ncbi:MULTISPECIES: hypothetical protein [Crateriforma]|uniref:Carboxypeptidase regulatory-like domain-containing protein n=1 Tax=Crateriforma conspicua TaxID=2527996 RepID=A0A5C6FTK3_9PLAN|nr:MULTISPECIES: hypothetical protein [Crateriforma]TWU66337.1 hypothetical protein V7x_19010 [Crateriforma conspicua]